MPPASPLHPRMQRTQSPLKVTLPAMTHHGFALYSPAHRRPSTAAHPRPFLTYPPSTSLPSRSCPTPHIALACSRVPSAGAYAPFADRPPPSPLPLRRPARPAPRRFWSGSRPAWIPGPRHPRPRPAMLRTLPTLQRRAAGITSGSTAATAGAGAAPSLQAAPTERSKYEARPVTLTGACPVRFLRCPAATSPCLAPVPGASLGCGHTVFVCVGHS